MNRAGIWLIIAGLYGAIGVAAGAWAAHGLADGGVEQRLAETATRYQMLHAVVLTALCAVRLEQDAGRIALAAARGLLALGTLLFCGTLYMLALGRAAPFSGSAPLGGAMLIGGWLCVAVIGMIKLRTGGTDRH